MGHLQHGRARSAFGFGGGGSLAQVPESMQARHPEQPGGCTMNGGHAPPCLTFADVVNAVVPEHTRLALHACAAEVRQGQVPKDLAFFLRHAKALQPYTLSGWMVSLSGCVWV